MPWQEVIGVVQDVRENGVDQMSPAICLLALVDGQPRSPGTR